MADKVQVVSKRDEEQHIWESDAAGSFTVRQDTQMVHGEIKSGTKVICFLKPEMSEFLQAQRLEDLVKKYCSSIPFPINLVASHDVRGKKRPAESSAGFERTVFPTQVHRRFFGLGQ